MQSVSQIHHCICAQVYMGKPEVDVECFPQLSTTLFFEKKSLTELGAYHFS